MIRHDPQYPYEVEISHRAYYGEKEFFNRYNSHLPSIGGYYDDTRTHMMGLRNEINEWISLNTDGGCELGSILSWGFTNPDDAMKFIKAGFGSYTVKLRDLSDGEWTDLKQWYEGTSKEGIWRQNDRRYIKFDRADEASYCKMMWG
jgi:hypothetical protein